MKTYRIAEPEEGDALSLRFGGDGWDEIRHSVRSLPVQTRRYDPEGKRWVVRRTGELERLLEQYRFTVRKPAPVLPFVEDEQRIALSAAVASPSSYAGSRSGLVVRGYQAAGVDYLLALERVLLADQMGLGKTAQALVAAREANAFPLCIVCPATLKHKWAQEAADWLFKGAHIQTVWSGKDRINKHADVVVVNYDVLAPAKQGDRFQRQLDGIAKRIADLGLAGLICDESHRLKSASARRTKAVRLLASGVRHRYLLSGTAAVNKPTDLAAQLAILGRAGDFGGYSKFMRYYEKNGRSKRELEKLNRWLRSVCYVRREKSQGLPDLPEKSRAMVPVAISNPDEYRQAQEDLASWLREHRGQKNVQIDERTRVEYLRQVVAEGKLEAAKAWIRDFLESGQQLVVFGHHTSVVAGIAQAFGAPSIMGGTPQWARQRAVERFQAGEERLIVCNLTAGGVGIDLFAASDVLFIEFAWTPADMEQAEDRCHRSGQVNPVTAWYLVGTGTIDEGMLRLLERKRGVVDATAKGSIYNEFIEELRYV